MSEPEAHAHKKKFEISAPMAIIIAGVIVAGAILYTNAHPAPATVADAAGQNLPATVNVPAPSASDHITGSPTAPIVLIEYSDFECPYCQLIYPELKDIVSQSNGQVAWVMRDFPLTSIHPQAMPAANAAECITAQLGNSAWWQFADDDFANQANIGAAFYSAEAQKLGANMTEYNACIEASTYESKINQEETDAENNGGTGTPYTIVVNTKTGKQYPISGALPEAQIQSVITQAMASQ